MFGFDKDETGSEERYEQRKRKWAKGEEWRLADDIRELNLESGLSAIQAARQALDATGREPPRLGRVRHHFWWMIHNLVAHPAIGLFPTRAAFGFHDWTSRKMNGLP
jgi:hypothetical protein